MQPQYQSIRSSVDLAKFPVSLTERRPVMRRTVSERRAALEERKRQLESELAALNAREKEASRKRDTRRKVIVGAAILAHAELHPAFAAELRHILAQAVTREIDRRDIADLLPNGTSTQPLPAEPKIA